MKAHNQLKTNDDVGPGFTVACSCGSMAPARGADAWPAWREHLRALGLCPKCQNLGTYAVENGNARYAKRCSCAFGRRAR